MPRFTHSLAFVFTSNYHEVVLIEKQRPAWQKGFWNGLGGKVEPEETILDCVVREVEEESGIFVPDKHWTQVAILTSPDWQAQVYATTIQKPNHTLVSETGEKIGWFGIHRLPNVIDNIHWLIPLSQNKLENPDLQSLIATYDSKNRS